MSGVGWKSTRDAMGGRFAEIMSRYGVGAHTTAMHRWNRGWLTNADLRDDLIDQYAQH
jgi:hypothetical protein